MCSLCPQGPKYGKYRKRRRDEEDFLKTSGVSETEEEVKHDMEEEDEHDGQLICANCRLHRTIRMKLR